MASPIIQLRDKIRARLDQIPHARLLLAILIVAILLILGWQIARGILFPTQFAASGVLETDEDNVSSEIAGRVVELIADEGDAVQAGQPLAKLDSVLLSAQVEQADAALAFAQANLDKLQNGARPEEIAQARGVLAQAVARRDGAKNALADAQASKNNPQDLNLRVIAARTNLDALEHRALAASLVAQGATLEREYWDRTIGELAAGVTVQTPQGPVTRFIGGARLDDLRQQASAASAKEWSAWATQGIAIAQRDAARGEVDNLATQQSNPLTLNLQADNARAQLDAAEAAVKIAQAKLDALTGGTRAENIAAAKGQVEQARGSRDALKSQLNKLTLTAPRAGIVSQRLLHLGEIAAPGAAVYHIVNLDQMTLTIYVPEDQIGKIKTGAHADVKVDSFPGRVFAGMVGFISPQAEFTPKNIATKDQRATQVFAVKISVSNSDRVLKPGMPADGEVK